MNIPLSTRLTAEEFEALSDTKGYELLDGFPVEKPMGSESSRIQSTLNKLLGNFIDDTDLGYLMDSECGYRIFADRLNRVRKPDLSFISHDRVPEGGLPPGDLTIVPNLVIEGVSVHELTSETNGKLMDFLLAGVPLVWVVHPQTETVQVFRQDRSATWLTNQDELSGEDVLPGFLCQVSQIFVQLRRREST